MSEVPPRPDGAGDRPAPPSLDWGLGAYEHTAALLAPVARLVVDRAAPRAGERVVDVGCGTGNAALAAAATGASVTGVDPAPRLLDVARARAAAGGLPVAWVAGTAAGMPLPDGCADVVLSVFAVIFAPDPAAAVAGMARVAAPGARAVMTAWIPEGPVAEMSRAGWRAARAAAGCGGEAPPPFPWHDPEAQRGLWEPHGFAVSVTGEALALEAPSVDAYMEIQFDHHPASVAGRARMGAAEQAALRAECRRILEEGNEDPAGFRVSSRYAMVTATRTGPTAAGR
jgi:SAM-dependent methyltransferase